MKFLRNNWKILVASVLITFPLWSFMLQYGIINNWSWIDYIIGNISIDSKYYETFILIMQVCLTFTIGYCTIHITSKQTQLQKSAIKVQMFDKRYKVFQAVVDARSLLNREDHIMTGLYNASNLNNIGSQMTDTYNTLRDSLVELIKQNELKIQQILVMYADNIEQMSIELNKIIPEFAMILKPWQDSVVEFNSYLESSGMQKDFDDYLMIHNLDK